MRKIYTLFTILFFALSFNISAQETVIAVWDFVDGSTVGVNGDGFTTTGGNSLGWLKNGDQSGVSDPNSVVCAGKNGFSASFIQNLDITSTDLVDGKLHVSMTFNNIDLTAAADGTASIMAVWMKGAGNTTGNFGNNHRMAGLKLTHDAAGAGDIKVENLVFNNGVQWGGQKDVGGLGSSAVYNGQITIGTTMDFTNFTSSFWVGSPGEFPNTPFGLTTGTSAANQSTAWNAATQTMSPNALLKFLQFQTISGLGSVEVDQFKVSTGTYENTVADEDASTSAALSLQGILDIGISGNGGKAVHVRANEDIADLSVYKLQVWSNANTSPGASYTLSGSATAGDDILIANETTAMDNYMTASTIFDTVLDGSGWPSINGDDSIELLLDEASIEVFGNPGTDGSGEPWDYLDSWAYKVDGAWTYGGINCTDGSTTTWDSDCVYPFAIGNQPLTDDPRTILTFEEYPVSGDTWYGDAGQVTSIVADPDTSGGDHGNVGKMELAAAGEPWQNSQLNLVADTYAVSLLDGTTKRVTFDMYSTTATCGLIKLEQELNGGDTVEHSFNVSGTGWESITVDFTNGASNNGAAVNGEFNKIVLFFNYCGDAGNPTGTAPDVRYVDNISYLTGTYNEPPFNPGPAPIPTQLEEDVVSVYSNTYSNNIATNLNPGWGQATVQSEFQLAEGDTALLYSNLNYQGLLYSSTDVTTMDYVHLDYYTDDSTALGFYVIQEGTGENGYSIDTELGITTGQWVSVDIPLSAYTVTDLSGVNQIKTDGNGTVYLDNIYFWKTPDTTAPVITLTGANPQELTVGDAYVELGATASDDTDGDISASIVTDASTVDTATAGSYSVTYNVSDASGNNATEVVRTVTVEAALPPNDSDSEQFCASGTDAAPTTITLTPDDLTVNNGANLLSVSVSSGTIGSATWVGNWYDANLTVTGGVSDGVTATGLAAMAGLDITGFTSVTMISVDLDNYADTVEMCLNLSVTWELPTVSGDEAVCASGTDAAPTTITLTPDDLTVNEGQEITAVSVTSGTIGSATWVGNWYDANLTVTGGVSDGVTATGLAAMAGLDITGFTSVTMTSVDLDNYADTVEMCLNLSVTYLEPSCVTPTDLTVSGITTTGAIVSWVSDGSQFMIELQPAGSAQGTAGGYVIGDIEAYTATSVDLTGFLTQNTSYSVYVINVCGDVMSSWSDPISFTTLPAPIVPDYLNDFSTFPGDLWTEAQGSPITGLTAGATTSLWAADGFANDGFSGAARINIYATGRDEWLISPVFDLSAMNYFLNLDAAATEYGSSTLDAIWGSDDFAGLYVTTDDGATWTELYLWDGTNNPGAQGTMMPEIELSGYSTVQFGIYGESTASNEDIDFFVDNFSITAESQAPSCVAPINLTVSGITTTGAVVSWVSDGTQFMIELQPAGSAQGTAGGYVIGDIEAYTATSVDLTGFLTPNTSYSVYVVNVCDSSNSEYTGPLTFTTPNPASCGETVVYTQVASGDYNVMLTGGNPASVTISGDLEQSSFSDTCYDNIYVYDGAGTLLNAGNTCGVFTDVTYESTDGTISVNITNDGSVQNGDVSLAFSCVPPDTTAPVITLTGDETVELFFGDTYTDAGASASDDVDGDLTSSIVVAGVVDVLTVGTYTVTYNVSDAAGNAATEVTRTVNVTIDSVRSILTFEEYPVTGDTWYGDAGQVTSIVADPDTSGGDHGNVGKMELAAAGEPWQNSQLNLVADTYAVNLLDGTAKRIIFDMWSETATCGLIKFEQGLNGAGNKELAFNVSGNGWETIVVDFTSGGHDGSAVNGEYNKIVLFFNYCDAAGNPIGTAPDVRYVDNISYLQGTLNEPPFNPGPAPIPTQSEEDVVSVYSDTYSNNIATNLNPGWGQATAQSEFQLAEGDTALLYSNLNYQGLLYTSTDVTTMDYVHLDYYTDDSTALGFYVIQEGTGENGYSIDTELGITTGQWVSVDIPLSHYTGTDLSGVNQIKTDGNGTVYLDNIYFYTEPTAGIEDAELSQFTYFPNPVNNVLTIKAQASIDSITVYNMLGQSVIRSAPNTNNSTVDMSVLQTGAYFVQVSINKTLKTVRVIKN